MKVLIMAAGLGSRLGELTKDTPKAMIDVAGKRLIDHALTFIDKHEVDEIGIVGGYGFEGLKAHLSDQKVKLFFNPDFREGNILTLMTAMDFLDTDFLLMNVDHIYPKRMFSFVINHSNGISAICDYDRKLGMDDMKVKLSHEGKLKKISKQLTDFDAGYIGMTYCSSDMLPTYKKSAKETLDIYGRGGCVEFILGHMAANDININITDASGFGWLEVDTPEERAQAEEALRST